jgi:hypothetical protein
MLRFCIEIVQPSSDQGYMPMLFDPMVDGGRVNPSPSQAGHHQQPPADYSSQASEDDPPPRS